MALSREMKIWNILHNFNVRMRIYMIIDKKILLLILLLLLPKQKLI
jgi:hypothetical protein